MATAESRVGNQEAETAEWLARLDELVSDVKRWVEPRGWQATQETMSVTEPGLERYEVPILNLVRDEVDVIMSPYARPAPALGADGVVDFFLMPGYDDLFRLCFDGRSWFVQNILPRDKTAPSPMLRNDERLPLDETTLNRVLDAFAEKARNP